MLVANTHKTKPHKPDMFSRTDDDALVADFRALIVSDLPRAKALVAQFISELQDPVLLRFAEADEDDESSIEADAWAETKLREVLVEGKWHTAEEAKQALLGE